MQCHWEALCEAWMQGGFAIAVVADVLDKDALGKADSIILNEFGPRDLLINGAGGNDPSATTSCERFEEK